jgi:enoyl-CoA hydratase/carnithine racemase
MAKELLFSARIVEAEEAHQIGLLNHLVTSAELRDTTMELAKQIAANHTPSVVGIKRLLLEQQGATLQAQWQAEQTFTRDVLPGAKAEDAFPDFIARKGRTLPNR